MEHIRTASVAPGQRITLETRYGTMSRGSVSIFRYESADAYEIDQTGQPGLVSKLKKGHVIINAPGFYVIASTDGFTRNDKVLVDVSAGETTNVTQAWKL